MARYRKKAIIVTAYRAEQDQYITTLEGVSQAKRGDYIVTGVDNEQWAVKPEWFTPAYTHLSGNRYQRKPQILEAVQITKPEVSKAPTGDIKGSVGDWRVTGKSGEQWYVKPDIFDKTYEKVGGSKVDNKSGLQKAIDQIGEDAVRKSIPLGAKIGMCDLHGAYMVNIGSEMVCPICPTVPEPNGTNATDIDHYIDVKEFVDPTSGINPGQKLNPLGI